LITDYGIQGDAHAGNWHRQVSLLAGESIDKMKEKMPGLSHGAFAENIIIRAFDIRKVRVGYGLAIGNKIILEVMQIGKNTKLLV